LARRVLIAFRSTQANNIRMKRFSLSAVVGVLLLPLILSAQTVKDREGAIRNDRKQMTGNARWIYNDIDAGFAEAQRSGKPLMVILRCVPCMACMGIDTEVLTENADLKPLMDQFVRVRVINANALDLSRFQFDYDLSFSTLFFNGDGTTYGRYGSWEHQHDSQNRATATYRDALRAALELHQNYPANRKSLAGKQGRPFPYKRPVEMPILSGKYDLDLNWRGNVVKSCVHCHQIGDSIRLDHRSRKEAIPTKWIYPYPTLAALGFEMDEHDLLKVKKIESASVAANSGLQVGDRITAIDGQVPISTADVSWALHHAPDKGLLKVKVLRSGREINTGLRLPAGWRTKTDIARRVGTWPMRAMAFGGMFLIDLTDAERQERGLPLTGMALRAKHVGQYGKHAGAKRQGFIKEDVIVALNGQTARVSESELLGKLISGHKAGAKLPATVLRKGKRLNLKLPIQ
jgi:serine protease Do